MKISEYIKNYTKGDRITLWRCLDEVRELLIEVFKLDWEGVKKEYQDVMHFLQLWLLWRFKIDGEIWKCSEDSVQEFIARKEVWQKIYVCAGLNENISNYVGNYKKEWKVVEHLTEFGVTPKKAKECYTKIVLGKI